MVTLITDFGTVDGYVGEVKGVLLSRGPTLRPVDITHEIPPGDVRSGAWALARIWARFPPGTVHLVVVDPGVGSARHPVAVEAEGRWFVGPDNGLLTRVLAGEPPPAVGRARILDPARPGLPPVSDTFHGRDLFAPAAAHLAAGGPAEELGPALSPSELVHLPEPAPSRRGGRLEGHVVHVDRFGTLVTDLPVGWLPERPEAEVAARRLDILGRSFADVDPGELLLLRGSGGTLEIAARGASAAEILGVGRGERVLVRAG